MTSEEKIHASITQWIKIQYLNLYFLSDPSGIKMSIGMAVKLKKTRSKHAQLDIVILEPSKEYKGLILEVKKSKDEVYKKNGQFRQNEHLQDQLQSIQHLVNRGYKVRFVWSLEMAMNEIKKYLQ